MANLESTIALIKTENSNLICMWCGKDTTGDKTREHIFPECIGGKKRLPAGCVCANCNNHFSHRIDRALLKEHGAIMDAYQADLGIKRKGRGGKNKKRYQEERKQIQGIGEASSTRIDRHGGTVRLINVGHEITSGDFVRSLHKCVANIICDLHGSMYVRKTCPDLLAFVQNGGDVRPWNYAISYPVLFDRILISEPRVINRCSIENDKKGTHEIISFIHTSGIWMVGSSPFLLGPDLIRKISDSIMKGLIHKREPKSKKPMTAFFGFEWDKEHRSSIGELHFLWIVREIEGKPNNEFLYLLTKCKVCGQPNPTMFNIPRNKLLEEKYQYGAFDQNMNTWNYTKGGVPLKLKNDVKKMSINNCKTRCINCGITITYSAIDCFL